MKVCVTVRLDNRTNPIEFQGHRSKVKVTGPDFGFDNLATQFQLNGLNR